MGGCARLFGRARLLRLPCSLFSRGRGGGGGGASQSRAPSMGLRPYLFALCVCVCVCALQMRDAVPKEKKEKQSSPHTFSLALPPPPSPSSPPPSSSSTPTASRHPLPHDQHRGGRVVHAVLRRRPQARARQGALVVGRHRDQGGPRAGSALTDEGADRLAGGVRGGQDGHVVRRARRVGQGGEAGGQGGPGAVQVEARLQGGRPGGRAKRARGRARRVWDDSQKQEGVAWERVGGGR